MQQTTTIIITIIIIAALHHIIITNNRFKARCKENYNGCQDPTPTIKLICRDPQNPLANRDGNQL